MDHIWEAPSRLKKSLAPIFLKKLAITLRQDFALEDAVLLDKDRFRARTLAYCVLPFVDCQSSALSFRTWVTTRIVEI